MRLLLDTNVLVLLIVGSLSTDLIGQKAKLKNFDLDDFVLVARIAREATSHISTPNVLTEVSNHLGSGKQQLVPGGLEEFAKFVFLLDEFHFPSNEIVRMPEFNSLGLTDAGILRLADDKTCVVSVDFHLCNRLAGKGVDVINPRNAQPV